MEIILTRRGQCAKLTDWFFRNLHWVLFLTFLVIHAICCIQTNLFGDDYYYAAFTKRGLPYFISENLTHYLHTNGRVLVHLLDELLLSNFWLWRIFNVAALGLTLLAVAKIAAGTWNRDASREKFRICLIVATTIFSATDVAILRQSVYWATGSLNYLVPTAGMLWFYYLFRRCYENNCGKWQLIPAAFFAAATNEQASAAVLLVALCFIVSTFVFKKMAPKPSYVASFAAGLVGFCTLYLSPGNAERMNYYPDFYALSLFERPGHNLKELTTIVFGRGGMYMVLIALFLVEIIVCKNALDNVKICPVGRLASVLVLLVNTLNIGLYIWLLLTNSENVQSTVKITIMLSIFTAMIYSVVKYFREKDIETLFFVWCAVAMQVAMSFSPVFGPRNLLISVCCLLIPISKIISENRNAWGYAAFGGVIAGFSLLPTYISSEKLLILMTIIMSLILIIIIFKKEDITIVIMPIIAISLFTSQFATVAAGYSKNADALRKNYELLADYSLNPTGELKLFILPESQYKYTMPYNGEYHQRVLLELYGIDPSTPVHYVEYNAMKSPK